MNRWRTLLCILSVAALFETTHAQTWKYYDAGAGFDNVMNAFSSGQNGVNWIGSVSKGVYKFKDGALQTTMLPSENEEITRLCSLNDTVWAASNNGLIRIVDGAAPSKVTLTYSTDIILNVFLSVARDSSGVIWVGGGSMGAPLLLQYTAAGWTQISDPAAHLENGIFGLEVDQKGNVWVASDGGISKFDGVNWTNYNTGNSGLPAGHISGIAFDAASNVWLSIWPGGVARFDGATWTSFTQANAGLSTDMVNDVAVDPHGHVWAGTQNAGLCMYDGVAWSVMNKTNSGLKSNFIQSLGIDAAGAIWVGTMDKGINVLTESTTDAQQTNAAERACDALEYFQNIMAPSGSVHVRLATRSNVRITVHDIIGRERAVLADRVMDAGTHVLPLDWSATGLASGVYFIRMATDRGVMTRKATHLR